MSQMQGTKVQNIESTLLFFFMLSYIYRKLFILRSED